MDVRSVSISQSRERMWWTVSTKSASDILRVVTRMNVSSFRALRLTGPTQKMSCVRQQGSERVPPTPRNMVEGELTSSYSTAANNSDNLIDRPAASRSMLMSERLRVPRSTSLR